MMLRTISQPATIKAVGPITLARSPALKVLITTGYPGHAELLRSDFAVLPKPFTRLDLERLIRSLIDRSGQASDGTASPAHETALN